MSALYSRFDRLLKLTAAAKIGDTACLTLRDYRIELAVNGRLLDEEWPFGDALFEAGRLTENTPVTVGKIPPAPEPPAFWPGLPFWLLPPPAAPAAPPVLLRLPPPVPPHPDMIKKRIHNPRI